MEAKWQKDALFNGTTANALKLGTSLSLGWFWMRVCGCCVLYRGPSIATVNFDNILGVAEQDADDISTPSYLLHEVKTTYIYIVRRVNCCGDEEDTLSASVKVSFDSEGNIAAPRPNSIFAVAARQIKENKVELTWLYNPLEQRSEPICFSVYGDEGSGQVDYENPLTAVIYRGLKFYSWVSGELEEGTYLFSIRAKDAAGIQDESLRRVSIGIDTVDPNAIEIVDVGCA